MILRASSWVILLRAACLIALGTSVALLVDYVNPEASFCGLDSGCGAVRLSGYGYIPLFGFGQLPVPTLGVLAFALLLSASLQRVAHLRAALVTPLAYSSALVALALIALQALLGEFCSLCLTVDVAALVCALCAFRLSGRGWSEAVAQEESRSTLMEPLELMSEGQRVKAVWRDDSQVYDAPTPLVRPAPKEPFRLRLLAWIALGILAVLAPLGFPVLVKTSEIPSEIRSLYDAQQVTVVEFFDYQCPHCRELSPRLKKLVQEEGTAKLRFGYTPFPQHLEARDAARVTICAGEQDKEMDVAVMLFAAHDLSLKNVTELGRGAVKDRAAFDACLSSKRPDARIKDDTDRLVKAGLEGLPTTYIGGTRLLGALDDAVYLDAIRRAKDGSDVGGLSPWAYAAGVLALLIAIVLWGRVVPGDRRSIPG